MIIKKITRRHITWLLSNVFHYKYIDIRKSEKIKFSNNLLERYILRRKLFTIDELINTKLLRELSLLRCGDFSYVKIYEERLYNLKRSNECHPLEYLYNEYQKIPLSPISQQLTKNNCSEKDSIKSLLDEKESQCIFYDNTNDINKILTKNKNKMPFV